jgi:uncharacterized protein YhhL (DUF1145 family)
MKIAVLVLWAACIAAFFLPATSSLALPGQRLFWGLLIVHAIECVVFLPRLRRAGGSLAHHLVQTMIFGMFHARNVGGEAPSSQPG